MTYKELKDLLDKHGVNYTEKENSPHVIGVFLLGHDYGNSGIFESAEFKSAEAKGEVREYGYIERTEDGGGIYRALRAMMPAPKTAE